VWQPSFPKKTVNLPLPVLGAVGKLSLASHDYFQFLPAEPCPEQSEKQVRHSMITIAGQHTACPPFFDVLCAQCVVHFGDQRFCCIACGRGFWLQDAILNIA
jgi:hypothetical protein